MRNGNARTAAHKGGLVLLLGLCAWLGTAQAQNPTQGANTVRLCFQVTDELGASLQQVRIYLPQLQRVLAADSCHLLPAGQYQLELSAQGRPALSIPDFELQADTSIQFILPSEGVYIGAVQVRAQQPSPFSTQRLPAIEGVGIYAGKKSELILPENLTANLAANNARQVFARVPGLNIWESDGGGVQLAIGARGLNPNRLASFNLRQNGYDISADALGYPESYYTPPLQAVERIEVLRGAASLQYGPQFGGMINFVLKEAPTELPYRVQLSHTTGSWNLQNTFASMGARLAPRLSLYSYVHRKTGDDWRPNSHFAQHTAYLQLHARLGQRSSLKLDYTHMQYLAQQPGGLTDRQFDTDPGQSLRSRNWFAVYWNLLAATYDYKLSDRTRINVRTFGLIAGRDALGNLDRINRLDLGGLRSLISDTYRNVGGEARVLHRLQLTDSVTAHVLLGARLYRGRTHQLQGLATANSDADFALLDVPENENSNYRNPSDNLSLFAETVFFVGSRLSLTPGLRLEYLNTRSDGYYIQRVEDFAGNLISAQRIDDRRQTERTILLAGLGAAYQLWPRHELYANFTQNYRPINFSDIRLVNPNQQIDPNLKDERGYNADLGLRGQAGEWLIYDVSLFYLYYANRIGEVLRADQPPLFLPLQYRTNVGASASHGLEGFAEAELLHFLLPKSRFQLSWYVGLTLLDGTYLRSDLPGVEGRQIEFAPRTTVRTGLSLTYAGFSLAVQYSQVGRQFTDATNTVSTASAVVGEIPSYQVADVSARYTFRFLTLEAGVQNTLDARYFTRRASSYPGPGILPSAPRNYYLGLSLRLQPPSRQ
ncbi:MAG: TonB-dependent receptor family protein [Sphingobacteriia bacterium]|jgi:Fe(3+) dicitrate transport protein